jgi:hypothetical protein
MQRVGSRRSEGFGKDESRKSLNTPERVQGVFVRKMIAIYRPLCFCVLHILTYRRCFVSGMNRTNIDPLRS